jgi:Transposase
LDGLMMIGTDEVSYGGDRRFLTCVADHASGGGGVGRSRPERRHLAGLLRSAQRQQKLSIKAVSIDMSAGYEQAITYIRLDSESGPVPCAPRSDRGGVSAQRLTRSSR